MIDTSGSTRWRQRAWVGLQFVLVLAALVFFVRLTRGYWGTIAKYRFAIQWTLVAISSLVWAASFAFLVRLWGDSLRWWEGRPLAFWSSLRVFAVSNLARYVPGAVWQFAGLAATAVSEGVSPLAAGSAALIQQLALLISAVVLTMAVAPSIAGQWAARTPTVPTAVIIIGGVAAAVLLAVLLWRPLRTRLGNRLRGWAILPQLRMGPLLIYLVQVTIAWVGYGVAFWLFGRALLGDAGPGMFLAASAYVASYAAGIIAVFAPGGIVVREAALVATLGPVIGAEHALVLALASRLWLVALEIMVAGLFFGVERRLRSRDKDQPGSLRP